MADVSGQEAQVVEALKNGGQIPERYNEGPEIEPGGFEGLRDEELVALYGTLAEVPAKEMADALDVSSATVSNYRSRLVEQDYLRNLQPGKGRSDYRPGLETADRIPGYEPEIPVLEDLDAAEPLETGEEEIRWLIGEELYELREEGLYEDLGGKEALALEMTLEGKSRDEIAEFLDVAPGTVSTYRTDLVEKGYMRNLNPGRGPGEYIPGVEAIEAWDNYIPEIEMLEADPARPLEGGEGLEWLLGEELTEILSETGIEEEEVGEEEGEASETDFRLNGYSEAEVAEMLIKIGEGDAGFGRIAEELGQETAHGLADDLEGEGLLEEDRDQVSGLAVTDQGENYLENVETVANEDESSNGSTSRSSRSSKSRSSTSSSRSRSRRSNGSAEEELLELGDELLDGHEEEMSQDERAGIDSRDLTDSDSADVEVEDDNAGYEGFT